MRPPCGRAVRMTSCQRPHLALQPGLSVGGVGLPRHPTLRPGNASVQLPTSTPRLAAKSFCRRVSAFHAIQPCGRATLPSNCQRPHLALRPGLFCWRVSVFHAIQPCGRATLPSNCQRPHLALRPGLSVGGCRLSTPSNLAAGRRSGSTASLWQAIWRWLARRVGVRSTSCAPSLAGGALFANHWAPFAGGPAGRPSTVSNQRLLRDPGDAGGFGRHPLSSRRIWVTADLSAMPSCDSTRLVITEPRRRTTEDSAWEPN